MARFRPRRFGCRAGHGPERGSSSVKPSRVQQLTFLFGGLAPAAEEHAPPAEPPAPRRASPPVKVGPVTAPVHLADRAQRLHDDLRVLLGGPVRLRVHDNRSTMVSLKREADLLHLRVHHMFLDAGPDVVRALADYARQRSPRAGRVLDDFVKVNRTAIKPVDVEKARRRPLEPRGAWYDLQAIYDDLNARYFGGAVTARIGWGRGSNRRRRSIRMGAYFHETTTILIHPALDRGEVPRFFVELVVYHEMLHQAVPHRRGETGRRCIHSPEFRERERRFEHYDRARAWERRHLSMLLKPAKSKRQGGAAP